MMKVKYINTSQIINRLVDARKQCGLSQHEAALEIGFSGASTLSQYESQRNRLSIDVFLKLCDLYEVCPIWAMTGVVLTTEQRNIMAVHEMYSEVKQFSDNLDDLMRRLKTVKNDQ
jgi:transcriptional regulator with XRE-family HTH domain